MRICVLGGIYGQRAEYREVVTQTPETVLSAGLRVRGHTVAEHSHSAPFGLQGFDVVHVHHLGAGALAAAAAYPPVRFAYTPHSLSRDVRMRRLAARHVVARAGAVIALSETEARWQRTTYPGVEDRQHVIPNGIDDEVFRFRAPRRPAAGEPWRLLYVGQLTAAKGVGYLLRAVAEIDHTLSVELDLVYQVASDETALRSEVDRLGLTGVRFLGAREPAALADLYADAHVFVLPSMGEALPSVVSEAVMVGRPVVASDVGAVREQVGEFGRLVRPRDPAALAAAITGVMADYDRYTASARVSSEQAAARYSVTTMVLAHERLYEQVLDGPRPSRSAVDRIVDTSIGRALRARS